MKVSGSGGKNKANSNHAGESPLREALMCGAGWKEGKGIQQLQFTEVLDAGITLILM